MLEMWTKIQKKHLCCTVSGHHRSIMKEMWLLELTDTARNIHCICRLNGGFGWL